ncbi:MAG: prephenate dehydrogenase/arogenate dehydrogenase family protein, partial [Candidatus Omnitrophica bacterium]|nr:prephenate dehydrogenase/arogenate dehydrogenase family protein [Candidatus Omnitrophota bacterium]
MFNKIAIIGVGLIGGSIGLAAKKKKLTSKVIGIGRSELSLKKALKKKAVDEISLDKSKVKDADLVIIATPVGKIVSLVKELIPYLKKGTIITDVGSTKREIMDDIHKFLPQGISFMGGHPLAGSEKNGVEFADSNLFEKSICFLIPYNNQNATKSFKKLKSFWKKLGANTIIISAEEHDFLMAGISHLPHIIAVALVNSMSGVKWRKKDIT